MKIIKRNGQEAIFDEVKITNAIIGANKEVVETERLSEEEIDNITNDIKYKCQKMKRALLRISRISMQKSFFSLLGFR